MHGRRVRRCSSRDHFTPSATPWSDCSYLRWPN